MYENRTKYPKKKTQMYQQIQELPKKYNVIALVRMEKVRASQLLPLRKKLQGEVDVFSIKDKIAKLALKKTGIKGIEKLVEKLNGQCLLMFTNMSPFKLNVLLGKNKMMLSARGGDLASKDVVIPAKNTGIAPGPMLTDFKENGIPTKIDQGTIWIMKETIPAKKGEVISEKLAALLGKLDIKPIEASIVLNSALEKGLVYTQEEMIIDLDKFRNDLSQAHQEAVSLSIEAAYVTKDNIEQILAKASQSAKSVSVDAGYTTNDTKEQILQKAHSNAKGVVSKAKDYTPT